MWVSFITFRTITSGTRNGYQGKYNEEIGMVFLNAI